MKESDLALNRRRFLLASAGIAASVIVAPSLLDTLDRLGPRRLLVPSTKLVQSPYECELVWTNWDDMIASALRGPWGFVNVREVPSYYYRITRTA